MAVPRTRIAAAVARRTLEKGAGKAYAREVAAYLLAEGRTGELDSLLRDVQAEWERQGYLEAVVRSAHPLTADTKKEIQARLQTLYPDAERIIITEVADADIIGGVQIMLADRQLDLSIEGKLNRFKQLTTAGKE